MRRTRRRAVLFSIGLFAFGCTSSTTDSAPTSTTGGPAATGASAAGAAPSTDPAATRPVELEMHIQPGPAQLAIIGATPGLELELVGPTDTPSGAVDEQGALLWRQLEPGTYRVQTLDGGTTSQEVEVPSLGEVPDQSFYAEQDLSEGFGYITTRDGTTLSANVTLPGPIADGPYPTVVEYSGYTPSDPEDPTFAQLYTGLGFAYVGVNIRGTGCSGGSFQFFEPIQRLDGYDVIETVAAQDWVEHGEVGMVGVSYPGISQLFVAQTRPPHLAAITPLSVLDDSYRATLYPGGMLNTGFAVAWTAERQAQAQPLGQGWAKDRVAAGDKVCEANQALRLQNPDLLQMIEDHPFYEPELYDLIAPTTFVDDIEVPVFLAGAWQDEQTGGHFPHFLDRFTSSPHLYATMVNGLHTDSISLGILTEYIEFLQLYVAKIAPDLTLARFAAPLLASGITGVDGLTLPSSDLEGLSYEDAIAGFEARPAIRVLFEQGAAEGTPPASPLPRFEARFESWPVPAAVARSWYLTAGERLADQPPLGDAPAASYLADPEAVPATWYSGSSSAIWRADVSYDWVPIPDANAATWTSPPLLDDTVVVGEGTVQLFLRSSAADTDLEVTVSELRPDGTETYVQSGWLRASRRAFDAAASTETITVQRHLEADAEELPPGEFAEMRVPIFPVAHAFRAGSHLKLTVATPGGNRPVWVFDTLAGGETNEIAQTAGLASRLILPVVPGVEVPAGVPACGALRGQPCRPTP